MTTEKPSFESVPNQADTGKFNEDLPMIQDTPGQDPLEIVGRGFGEEVDGDDGFLKQLEQANNEPERVDLDQVEQELKDLYDQIAGLGDPPGEILDETANIVEQEDFDKIENIGRFVYGDDVYEAAHDAWLVNGNPALEMGGQPNPPLNDQAKNAMRQAVYLPPVGNVERRGADNLGTREPKTDRASMLRRFADNYARLTQLDAAAQDRDGEEVLRAMLLNPPSADSLRDNAGLTIEQLTQMLVYFDQLDYQNARTPDEREPDGENKDQKILRNLRQDVLAPANSRRSDRAGEFQERLNVAMRVYSDMQDANLTRAEVCQNAVDTYGDPRFQQQRDTLEFLREEAVIEIVEARDEGTPGAMKKLIIEDMKSKLSNEQQEVIERLMENEDNLDKVMERILTLGLGGTEEDRAHLEKMATLYANVKFIESLSEELAGDQTEPDNQDKKEAYFALLATTLLKDEDESKQRLTDLMFGKEDGDDRKKAKEDLRISNEDIASAKQLLPDNVDEALVDDILERVGGRRNRGTGIKDLESPETNQAAHLEAVRDHNRVRNWGIAADVYATRDLEEGDRNDALKTLVENLGYPEADRDRHAANLAKLVDPPADADRPEGFVPLEDIVDAANDGTAVIDGGASRNYINEMRIQINAALGEQAPAELADAERAENFEQMVDAVQEQATEEDPEGRIEINGQMMTSEEARFYLTKGFDQHSDKKWYQKIGDSLKNGGWKKMAMPFVISGASALAATVGGIAVPISVAAIAGYSAYRLVKGGANAWRQIKGSAAAERQRGGKFRWKRFIKKTVVPAVAGAAWGGFSTGLSVAAGFPLGIVASTAVEMFGYHKHRQSGLSQGEAKMLEEMQKYQTTFDNRVQTLTNSDLDQSFRRTILELTNVPEDQRDGLSNQQVLDKLTQYRAGLDQSIVDLREQEITEAFTVEQREEQIQEEKKKLRRLGNVIDKWMQEKDQGAEDPDAKAFNVLLAGNLESKEIVQDHYDQIATFAIFSGLTRTAVGMGNRVDSLGGMLGGGTVAAADTDVDTGTGEAAGGGEAAEGAPTTEMTNVTESLESGFEERTDVDGTLVGIHQEVEGETVTNTALYDLPGGDSEPDIAGEIASFDDDGNGTLAEGPFAAIDHTLPAGTTLSDHMETDPEFQSEYEIAADVDQVEVFDVPGSEDGTSTGIVGFINNDGDAALEHAVIRNADGTVEYVDAQAAINQYDTTLEVGDSVIPLNAVALEGADNQMYIELQNPDGDMVAVIDPGTGQSVTDLTLANGTDLHLSESVNISAALTVTESVPVEITEADIENSVYTVKPNDSLWRLEEHLVAQVNAEAGENAVSSNYWTNELKNEALANGNWDKMMDHLSEERGWKGVLQPNDQLTMEEIAQMAPETAARLSAETGVSIPGIDADVVTEYQEITRQVTETVAIDRTAIASDPDFSDLDRVVETTTMDELRESGVILTNQLSEAADSGDVAGEEGAGIGTEPEGETPGLPTVKFTERERLGWLARTVTWGNPEQVADATTVTLPDGLTEEGTELVFVQDDGSWGRVELTNVTDVSVREGGYVAVRFNGPDGGYWEATGSGARLVSGDVEVLIDETRLGDANYVFMTGEEGGAEVGLSGTGEAGAATGSPAGGQATGAGVAAGAAVADDAAAADDTAADDTASTGGAVQEGEPDETLEPEPIPEGRGSATTTGTPIGEAGGEDTTTATEVPEEGETTVADSSATESETTTTHTVGLYDPGVFGEDTQLANLDFVTIQTEASGEPMRIDAADIFAIEKGTGTVTLMDGQILRAAAGTEVLMNMDGVTDAMTVPDDVSWNEWLDTHPGVIADAAENISREWNEAMDSLREAGTDVAGLFTNQVFYDAPDGVSDTIVSTDIQSFRVLLDAEGDQNAMVVEYPRSAVAKFTDSEIYIRQPDGSSTPVPIHQVPHGVLEDGTLIENWTVNAPVE